MRTRSQSCHNSPQQEASPVIVEPLQIELPFLEDQFQEDPPPKVLMADNRTMAELLQAPTEGYEDAIVIPKIASNNVELKHDLINLVQNKQFFGHDKEDPHAHIRYFNKITSTMRVPNVPSSSIKLMLFPFSLEGAARIWLEKEPPRSIQTWDDLVFKFTNQFFPPSKTTNLRNKITRFQQRFDESFYEAWDRFNDLLRACPHHGFFELHQLDTFYNALNVNDQESLNSVAGGNFLDKMPREYLKIIESKSKVRQSRAKAVVVKTKRTDHRLQFHLLLLLQLKQLSPIVSLAVVLTHTKIVSLQAEMFIEITFKNMCRRSPQQTTIKETPVFDHKWLQIKFDLPVSLLIKTISIGGTISVKTEEGQNVQNQLANLTYMLSKFMSSNTASSSGSGTLPSNAIANPKEELKGITTRSGVAYQGPINSAPSKVVKQGTEPVVAPVSAPMPNVKYFIPYPSRRDNERRRDQANEQIEKFYKIFKDMSFEISFTDALILMPKFALTLKALIGNKEKLSEMARTPMNEHCSAVILNKLPRKLGDPGKFLILVNSQEWMSA
uniref:Reverse transcriptase domain-containing protein n=1 Tax=Tanacetum cinerariifolium TaxID=118510 RepID=A0A6L2MP05_TANCI|nr:reverse transcriptase domain-containing protein [Tanacetum cinerariifolium]